MNTVVLGVVLVVHQTGVDTFFRQSFIHNKTRIFHGLPNENILRYLMSQSCGKSRRSIVDDSWHSDTKSYRLIKLNCDFAAL